MIERPSASAQTLAEIVGASELAEHHRIVRGFGGGGLERRDRFVERTETIEVETRHAIPREDPRLRIGRLQRFLFEDGDEITPALVAVE